MRGARVDVVVVTSGTTPGLRRDHEELVAALREMGSTVATASTTYGLVGRLRVGQPLIDLVEAAALRRATSRTLERVDAGAILFPSSVAAFMQPQERLGRAGIRFDAPAAQNRPGWRNGLQRILEHRAFGAAALLLPYSERALAAAPAPSGVPVVSLPSPVRPGPPHADQRRRAGLLYAANPHKKGLDLAVGAWSRAAPPGFELIVAGIEPDDGRKFLRRRGVGVPDTVVWAGRLHPAEYRRLSASVAVYVGASRVDEYATTQLEALVDGAILVTVPSAGPLEPLELARELDPDLVAQDVSVDALARALQAAFRMDEAQRAGYRVRAAAAMGGYSREVFRERLRRVLVDLQVGTE